MQKKQLLKSSIEEMLHRIVKERMPNMHPFFHYIEIGGEGIGMNKWNAKSGITEEFPTAEAVIAHYDAIRQPYRTFAQKDLLRICEELDARYTIDLTFFKSLWQAIYLFSAQGDEIDPPRLAEELLSFTEWFRSEFSRSLGFPTATPIFVGHAYPADIVGEHLEEFFSNLRVRLASIRHFFPGDVGQRFTSFRFPDKQVTLLNAAMTGATRRHTEYLARIGDSDLYFRFRLGHTDCGNGFYLTLSYLPFGYEAKTYSRALRGPDSSPDTICKCGGDYAADGSFRIKNIQGGAQFKTGMPTEVSLDIRERILNSSELDSLKKMLVRTGIEAQFLGSIPDAANFAPSELNLFSVPRQQKTVTEKALARWASRHSRFLESEQVRIVSDDKLEMSLRDESDLIPERVGYRLSHGDIFGYYKEIFGDFSPFDLVVLKLIQIITRTSGFTVSDELYDLREIRIISASLNRWIGHSHGRSGRYKEMYDERARKLGFRKEGEWFRFVVDRLWTDYELAEKLRITLEALIKQVLAADKFQLFHNSDKLDGIHGFDFAARVAKKGETSNE